MPQQLYYINFILSTRKDTIVNGKDLQIQFEDDLDQNILFI